MCQYFHFKWAHIPGFIMYIIQLSMGWFYHRDKIWYAMELWRFTKTIPQDFGWSKIFHSQRNFLGCSRAENLKFVFTKIHQQWFNFQFTYLRYVSHIIWRQLFQKIRKLIKLKKFCVNSNNSKKCSFWLLSEFSAKNKGHPWFKWLVLAL